MLTGSETRLTEKSWRNLDPWECCGQDDYCKRGCHDEGGCTKGCVVPRNYDRLAKYEDIGTVESFASLAAENERLKNAAELKAKTEAIVNPVVNSYVHELLAELVALKDGIRDWAHDYGIDHDDKAMQELEAILGGKEGTI
jgi:hypothetical protein